MCKMSAFILQKILLEDIYGLFILVYNIIQCQTTQFIKKMDTRRSNLTTN